jgi:hypothetical protein
MKFWQLVSIAVREPGLISHVASTRPSWKRYELLASDFSNLVRTQDRAALDSFVDTDFAVAVLDGVRMSLYLSADGWLRKAQLDSTDRTLSVLDSFKRYGADIVEDVCEKGSAKVR